MNEGRGIVACATWTWRAVLWGWKGCGSGRLPVIGLVRTACPSHGVEREARAGSGWVEGIILVWRDCEMGLYWEREAGLWSKILGGPPLEYASPASPSPTRRPFARGAAWVAISIKCTRQRWLPSQLRNLWVNTDLPMLTYRLSVSIDPFLRPPDAERASRTRTHKSPAPRRRPASASFPRRYSASSPRARPCSRSAPRCPRARA